MFDSARKTTVEPVREEFAVKAPAKKSHESVMAPGTFEIPQLRGSDFIPGWLRVLRKEP